MNHDFSQSDQLEWDAFRFISGEMNADEMSLFESRLDRDLEVCEAVARVTEISLAVSGCRPSKTTVALKREPRSVSSWVGMAAAVAAMLILSIVLKTGQHPETPPDTIVETNPLVGDAELLSEWNRNDSPLFSEPALVPDRIDVLNDRENETIPTWMIAAVSLSETEMDDVSPSSEMKEN